MIKDIFLAATIPHTGTNFIVNILYNHSLVISLNTYDPGIGSIYTISHAIDEGKIDYNQYKQILGVMAYYKIREKYDYFLNNLQYIFDLDKSIPIPYVLLVHHTFKFIGKNTNFGDMLLTTPNFKGRKILTVRDPLLALSSHIIEMCKLSRSANRSMENFEHLSKQIRNEYNRLCVRISKGNCGFIFPVDLYANRPIEERRRLIESFYAYLDLPMENFAENMIYSWTKFKPITYGEWMCKGIAWAKEEMVNGGYAGICPLLDKEREYFNSNYLVKNVFKELGYKNLTWF